MIKLDVSPYCHECSDFEPTADTVTFDAVSISGKSIRYTDTVVRCKHVELCQRIYNYIEKIREKNELYNEVKNQGGELI